MFRAIYHAKNELALAARDGVKVFVVEGEEISSGESVDGGQVKEMNLGRMKGIQPDDRNRSRKLREFFWGV